MYGGAICFASSRGKSIDLEQIRVENWEKEDTEIEEEMKGVCYIPIQIFIQFDPTRTMKNQFKKE